MCGMNKRLWGGALLILLTAAGITAGLGLRPAWEQGQIKDYTDPAPLRLPELSRQDTMSLRYRWQLAENPSHTLLLGDAETLTLLQAAQPWEISAEFAGGELRLHSVPPQLAAKDTCVKTDARFYVKQAGTSVLYLPSGTAHTQYHITMAAEITLTPCFWQQPRHLILMQQMVLDPVDKAADLVTPAVPAALAHLPAQQVISGRAAALPARFCGSTAEQELERFLFLMAALRSAEDTETRLPMLRRKAQEMAELYTNPDLPWPDCWGRAADKARQNAQRVIPVLQRLQEEDCYGSAELADFINGPLFTRLFGK